MARPKRVLSFMTQWGNAHLTHNNNSSAPNSPAPPEHQQSPGHSTPTKNGFDHKVYNPKENSLPPSPTTAAVGRPRGESNAPTAASRPGSRAGSRRNSLALGYQAPQMEVNQDTPPELQPIFSYLNYHQNKLYQEGYFLKLHDLDPRGRPSADRIWNECFAQLVGTVLSLWDAALLDAAGDDGEVAPTFVNLTDASIKMIESLPMSGVDGTSLQNVLSICTAANNRYLLHFNSLHSLTQWTAGIRLAMFEHATLQEAYTGSILACKGKYLNNIKNIMERSRFPTDDWVRVRFGAGTPWRRCWCVISPPDEKAFAKAQKSQKKKSAYDRNMPTVKGDIKFYDTRKLTKKTQPIATVTDASAAYGIYPQNQALIDQSTLIKVEGMITIHATSTTTTEGIVFVMPETHPAITGFEMMLRWLIPTFDTFALYGRPNKLIADVFDTRSLMFAMPNTRNYGYLELIDVAGLIHTEGSKSWSEREWRRQMKILTSKRITSGPNDVSNTGSSTVGRRRGGSRSSINLPSSLSRTSLNLPPTRNGGVKFGDEAQSTPASRHGSPAHEGAFNPPPRSDTLPNSSSSYSSPHKRAASDRVYRPTEPSRLSFETHRQEMPPPPPPHAAAPTGHHGPSPNGQYGPYDLAYSSESSSEYLPTITADGPKMEHFQPHAGRPMQPVQAPPQMAHSSRQRPPVQPNAMPEMRRANSAIDAATLEQLAEANRADGMSSSIQDDSAFYSQPPSGSSNMPPRGNPNYVASAQHYGAPVNMNQMGPPMGPPGSQQQRRAPPGKLGPPSMPTIPGTPAHEQNQFELTTADSRRPPLNASRSSGSVQRKPLGQR